MYNKYQFQGGEIMKYDEKKEILFCDEGLPIKFGYSLGTVYEAKWDSYYHRASYKLYNYGYCPAEEGFYYINRNIHLPKNLIKYFENGIMDTKKKEEMQEIGIHNIDDINALLREFDKAKTQSEIAKQKILNLSKTIKNKNKKNGK